jgi:heme/copper-type cytochrome/quinol oxidase subunit 4
MARELVKFALLAGVTLLAAWIAVTGRVAYTFAMLVIAGALAYAVLDLVDYELVKRRRRD